MARTTPHDHPLTEGEPLYRRIATQLLGELHDGTIPPGERLPGERQLAETLRSQPGDRTTGAATAAP